MAEWLTREQNSTWWRVLQMHARLMATLAQQLKADSDMSIADYEVLATLSEAPQGSLRARDLRGALVWEKSRLAHQVRRMEQRGLVRRDACADDLRAPIVGITAEGRAIIEAAAPRHVGHVRELFFDALTPGQVAELRVAAEAVLAHLASHEADVDAD